MEDHEWDFFQQNKKKLVQLITCTETLRNHLYQNKKLSDEDMEELNKDHTKTKKTGMLLDMLRNQVNGYKVLVEGLRDNDQSGAVELLEKLKGNVTMSQSLEKRTGAVQRPTASILPQQKSQEPAQTSSVTDSSNQETRSYNNNSYFS